MRILFYGTPAAAVPFLSDLAAGHEVVGVVTRADKPAGRGLRLEPPPVKELALKLGLPVFQPERSADIAPLLEGLSFDAAVAVAYGRILRRDALDLPRLGTLNVHFSLLPRWRGAAPVQWSLAAGDERTGVTVFWLDEGLDTGPVAASRAVDVGPDEDAAALLGRLVALGREVLAGVLAEAAAGTVRREPQAGEPTLAPLIRRPDARLSLERPARELHNRVRAMALGPRAFLELETGAPGRKASLGILRTALDDGRGTGTPGTVCAVERGRGFLVECGIRSRLWILSVQPEGKREMPAAEFLNGLRIGAGGVLRTAA